MALRVLSILLRNFQITTALPRAGFSGQTVSSQANRSEHIFAFQASGLDFALAVYHKQITKICTLTCDLGNSSLNYQRFEEHVVSHKRQFSCFRSQIAFIVVFFFGSNIEAIVLSVDAETIKSDRPACQDAFVVDNFEFPANFC